MVVGCSEKHWGETKKVTCKERETLGLKLGGRDGVQDNVN